MGGGPWVVSAVSEDGAFPRAMWAPPSAQVAEHGPSTRPGAATTPHFTAGEPGAQARGRSGQGAPVEG